MTIKVLTDDLIERFRIDGYESDHSAERPALRRVASPEVPTGASLFDQQATCPVTM